MATPLPAGWVAAPLVKGGYARPLSALYCGGSIVKIEVGTTGTENGFVNDKTDWTAPRLWAVHFVNEAAGTCLETGWTVIFDEDQLEGVAPIASIGERGL